MDIHNNFGLVYSLIGLCQEKTHPSILDILAHYRLFEHLKETYIRPCAEYTQEGALIEKLQSV
jgi:hypothetical protein